MYIYMHKMTYAVLQGLQKYNRIIVACCNTVNAIENEMVQYKHADLDNDAPVSYKDGVCSRIWTFSYKV